jgi:hypothetical protein
VIQTRLQTQNAVLPDYPHSPIRSNHASVTTTNDSQLSLEDMPAITQNQDEFLLPFLTDIFCTTNNTNNTNLIFN